MCRSAPFVGYIAANGLYSTIRLIRYVTSNQMSVALCSHFPHKCVESSWGVQRVTVVYDRQ